MSDCNRKVQRIVATGVLLACASVTANAQEFRIDWYSVDGGGVVGSTGGTFEMSSTIGQPDAGVMTGGNFELSGGFWAGAVPQCACLGDMNSDGKRDGADISAFVGCVIGGGSCVCADVNGINGVTLADVTVFVADLLTGTACP